MQSKKNISILNFSLFIFSFYLLFVQAKGQSVAVLSPERSDSGRSVAERLEGSLAKRIRVLDSAMSEAAFVSAKAEKPFNLTTANAKAVGSAIGCDYFVLVRAGSLRRSSYERHVYYEAYAVTYAVSTRSGRLIFFRLLRFEAATPEAAQILLNDSVESSASEIEARLKLTAKHELSESAPPEMEEPPEDDSPMARNFRVPIPYRRIKPEYTADAFLYDIRSTVDIVVDLGRDGTILRTEIVRWAGYGLDESVEKAVRSMNWRPAMRGGKPLPMRFLVRYNFKKIESQ